MTRSSGPHLLDARHQIEAVLVRHDHVGDDEIALAVGDPAPQRRGIAGRPHLVPEPASAWFSTVRMARSSSATRIVAISRIVCAPRPACADASGRSTRNTVRRGWLSNSMTPPWSPTILATSARPRPVPLPLGRDERVEQVRPQVLGDAGAVVRRPRPSAADGDGRRRPAPPAAARADRRSSARSRRRRPAPPRRRS